MPSDSWLIEVLSRARSGDEQAAADLVRQYEPELRRYVRYRLTNLRLRQFLDSLDVSQSVFARFFVSLAEGRVEVVHPHQLFKLLFTIASNRLRDHLRWAGRGKRSHAAEPGPADELLAVVADGAPEPSQQVEERELVDMFRSRLNDFECRLLDRRMAGCSWEELAADPLLASLGRGGKHSPEALRKQLARAIDRAAGELGLGAEA